MKRASLLAAAAIVLAANAFALVHAWRNRSGPVETDITLTERELTLWHNSSDDDSGVAFTLRCIRYRPDNPSQWLDQKTLQEVGFDTSLAPSDDGAVEFYQRQRRRRAFVALEYDGPAWRKWIDDAEQKAEALAAVLGYTRPTDERQTSTRLVAIDASGDAVRLRTRNPDRSAVIIVPAVIHIVVETRRPNRPARLEGYIEEIPSSIHVPLPFSDAFQRLPGDRSSAKYRIHLRYGASFEPWIAGVEFPTPATR